MVPGRSHRKFENTPTKEVSTAPKQADAVFCSNEDVSEGGTEVFGRFGNGEASMAFQVQKIAQTPVQGSQPTKIPIDQCNMI